VRENGRKEGNKAKEQRAKGEGSEGRKDRLRIVYNLLIINVIDGA